MCFIRVIKDNRIGKFFSADTRLTDRKNPHRECEQAGKELSCCTGSDPYTKSKLGEDGSYIHNFGVFSSKIGELTQ